MRNQAERVPWTTLTLNHSSICAPVDPKKFSCVVSFKHPLKNSCAPEDVSRVDLQVRFALVGKENG